MEVQEPRIGEAPDIERNGELDTFLDDACKRAYMSLGGAEAQSEVESLDKLLKVYIENPYGMYAVRKMLFDTAHGCVAIHYRSQRPGIGSTIEATALSDAYRSGQFNALMDVFQYLSEKSVRERLDKARARAQNI